MKKVSVKFVVDNPPFKAGDCYNCNKMLASMLVSSGNAEHQSEEVKEKPKKSK